MQTKHARVHTVLKNEILAGRYDGKALPSEAAVVRRFGVSRITVQRALRDLEREGLVEKVCRKGSFAVPAARRGRTIELVLPFEIAADDAAYVLRLTAAAAARRGYRICLRNRKGG